MHDDLQVWQRGEAKVVYKEPLLLMKIIFVTAFIWGGTDRGEYLIGMHPYRSRKFYNFANMKRTANDTRRIPVHAA